MSVKYWLSWRHDEGLGEFELKWPWWISGYDFDDKVCICAAVRANSKAEAEELILNSYDKRPSDLDWRFCEEKPADWSPFSGRFPKADWMCQYWKTT